MQRCSKRRIDGNRTQTRKPSDIVSDVIKVCNHNVENTLSTKKADKSGFSISDTSAIIAVLAPSTEWPSVLSEELIAAIYAGGE